jgi:hypothetical protein
VETRGFVLLCRRGSPTSLYANQSFCKRSVMNSCRAFCVVPLVLLVAMAGCGGGSSFDPNNVTVTVSPPAITIPASGQVTLQATVKGSPAAPALTWSIAELQTNGASGSQCNWSGATPPAGPCPDGTIQGADASDSDVPCSQHLRYVPRCCSGECIFDFG